MQWQLKRVRRRNTGNFNLADRIKMIKSIVGFTNDPSVANVKGAKIVARGRGGKVGYLLGEIEI